MGGALRKPASGSWLSSNRVRKGYVYWVERTGKAAQFLTLNAAPIDIAPSWIGMLFRENCSCVLTSATLAVGRPDLAYFRDRIGAGSVEPLQLGSPFDFPTQMKLFVVRKMPDPRHAGYEKALAHWVAHFVTETDGRAFVLFTSYRGMQQLAEEMQSFFAENGMNLLVQGGGRVGKSTEPLETARTFSSGPSFGGAFSARAARRMSIRGCLSAVRIIVDQANWNCCGTRG